MKPVAYLLQGKFHRSVVCRRTGSRVSFALLGDWDERHHYYYPPRIEERDEKPLVLYVLPSAGSRYIGVLLDGMATHKGVRMLAIDRPGAGSTSSCAGHDRMRMSTQQTLSVLEALGYGDGQRRINIFTHSVGWLYALDLITERPALFSRTTRLAFSSPFVPTHCSGNMALALLPRSIVQLTPLGFSMSRACINSISWSGGVCTDLGLTWAKLEASSTTSSDEKQQQKKDRIRQKSLARIPKARFHPPYEPHSTLELEAWKIAEDKSTKKAGLHPKTGRPLTDGESLLFEYFGIEGGPRAATEDFLFCLGKVQGMSNPELETWMKGKVAEVSAVLGAAVQDEADSKPHLVVVSAESDFLIPAKGQKYLASLLEQGGMSAEHWIMSDVGHDAPLGSKEVLADVLDHLSQ